MLHVLVKGCGWVGMWVGWIWDCEGTFLMSCYGMLSTVRHCVVCFMLVVVVACSVCVCVHCAAWWVLQTAGVICWAHPSDHPGWVCLLHLFQL